MSDHLPLMFGEDADYRDTASARSLLDQLLTESRIYSRSKDYQELLDFVVRLRDFAPFNAMLLQIQKPGLTFAATARDWWDRFERRPKNGARPLLILRPFSPVAFVYDVLDTEGKQLPEDVMSCFLARGMVDEDQIASFRVSLATNGIDLNLIDAGDGKAGEIWLVGPAPSDKDFTKYGLSINKNHPPVVQFTTLAHELGHLFLGHLGADRKLKIADRRGLAYPQRELEAESVAYVVCRRNGVLPKSQSYLSNFVEADTTVEHLDIYPIMHAAGRVEDILELSAHKLSARQGQRGPSLFP